MITFLVNMLLKLAISWNEKQNQLAISALSHNDKAVKQLISSYLSIKAKTEDEIAKDKFLEFMKCLPSLKTLRNEGLKCSNTRKPNKNILFFKVCLDIYDDFLSQYDFPFYRGYKEFVKSVLFFYNHVSQECLDYICSAMQQDGELRSKYNSMNNIFFLYLEVNNNLSFNSRVDIIEHYSAKKMQMTYLSEGLDENRFIL